MDPFKKSSFYCVKITTPYSSQLIHDHMVLVLDLGRVLEFQYIHIYKTQPIVKSSRRLSTAMKHTFSLLVAVVIVGLCYSQDPTPGIEKNL